MKNVLMSLMCVWSFAAAANPGSEVSLEEFKKIVESKSAKIIDANSEKVYKEGHIPGAVSYAKNETSLEKVLPKNKGDLIVAYCGGPLCTAWEAPAEKAKKLGYTNIKHFKGGITGWKAAKLPTEKG